MTVRILPESELLRPPLLVTESRDAFEQIRDGFIEDVKPRTFIERSCVGDYAYLNWEILRYRRVKAGIINLAFREALETRLADLMLEPGESGYRRREEVKREAKQLAANWFSGPSGKKQVFEVLKQFHLDESAIEAEAIRRSAGCLEQIERILASLESRRGKALRFIVEYRAGLAQQLRKTSDRIIDGKALALEYEGSKEPTTAA